MTKHIKGCAIDYTLEDPERILLHVVNCQGVMGSGIALQVKERMPSAYESYISLYNMGYMHLGTTTFSDQIANLAAQDNYGRDKRQLNYGALSECLKDVWNQQYSEIVVPYKMGCDRAGGDWEVVLEMLEFYFPNLTVVKYNG